MNMKVQDHDELVEKAEEFFIEQKKAEQEDTKQIRKDQTEERNGKSASQMNEMQQMGNYSKNESMDIDSDDSTHSNEVQSITYSQPELGYPRYSMEIDSKGNKLPVIIVEDRRENLVNCQLAQILNNSRKECMDSNTSMEECQIPSYNISSQISKFGHDWLEEECGGPIGLKFRNDSKVMAIIDNTYLELNDEKEDMWTLKCENIYLTPFGRAYVQDENSGGPYTRFSIDKPEFDQEIFWGRF